MHYLGLVGFANAYLLTGDDRYLDVWRRQIDAVNSHKKVVDGRTLYPHMHGDEGWYDYTPQKYNPGVREIYLLVDAPRRPRPGRLRSAGSPTSKATNPDYPEHVLRDDFATIRRKVKAMRTDPTTPDTRLADDPMEYQPRDRRPL